MTLAASEACEPEFAMPTSAPCADAAPLPTQAAPSSLMALYSSLAAVLSSVPCECQPWLSPYADDGLLLAVACW